MRAKRKTTKKVRQKKTIKNTVLNNQKSAKLERCKEWIATQNVTQEEQQQEITPNQEQLTDNTDDIVADGPASLGRLKSKSGSAKSQLYFSCEWRYCLKNYETEDELNEHIVKHIVELKPESGKYCCDWDLCFFETKCNSEITRHIHYHAYHTILKTIGESVCELGNIPRCTNDSRNRNVVPELKNDFVCDWTSCGQKFKSIFLFHKHVKLHCTFESSFQSLERHKDPNPYHCGWDGCESKFNVVYRLTEHVRRHTNERNVGCYHCGAIFCSNTILFNHCKRQLANNTQEYQCAECFKFFASERLLRHHVVFHVNCFKCTVCNMTCNCLSTLTKHIRYRHLNERPFKCAFCDRAFVSKVDLNKHVERVHEKKVYECAEAGCEFSCKSLFILKRHDAEMHGNSPAIYACHCCEKMYKTGKTLSKHLIRVHGFQLPPGHSRFWYRIDENGYYRLQTMRIECLEVTKQVLSPSHATENNPNETVLLHNPEFGRNLVDLSVKNDGGGEEILVTISDVDKDGNVLDTKYVKAKEIKIEENAKKMAIDLML